MCRRKQERVPVGRVEKKEKGKGGRKWGGESCSVSSQSCSYSQP